REGRFLDRKPHLVHQTPEELTDAVRGIRRRSLGRMLVSGLVISLWRNSNAAQTTRRSWSRDSCRWELFRQYLRGMMFPPKWLPRLVCGEFDDRNQGQSDSIFAGRTFAVSRSSPNSLRARRFRNRSQHRSSSTFSSPKRTWSSPVRLLFPYNRSSSFTNWSMWLSTDWSFFSFAIEGPFHFKCASAPLHKTGFHHLALVADRHGTRVLTVESPRFLRSDLRG